MVKRPRPARVLPLRRQTGGVHPPLLLRSAADPEQELDLGLFLARKWPLIRGVQKRVIQGWAPGRALDLGVTGRQSSPRWLHSAGEAGRC